MAYGRFRGTFTFFLVAKNFLSDSRKFISVGQRCSFGTSPARVDLEKLRDPEFVNSMRENVEQRNSSVDLDELIDLYTKFVSGDLSLLQQVNHLFLSLPNSIHKKTPTGSPSETRLIGVHGAPKQNDFPSKSAEELLSNEPRQAPISKGGKTRSLGLGLLRFRSLNSGSGPRAYNFFGSLSILESALVSFTLDRLCASGIQFVAVPDILPATVIESCGFPTRGKRTQTFTIVTHEKVARYCLSGTAEMALAGFCSGSTFGVVAPAEYFCSASRCFRHEVSPQESPLYRNHQFTKVEIFCVCEPSKSVGDEVFERILAIQQEIFASLGLYFRVLEMPSSELGNQAHRKVDIEAFMPGEGSFGEISSTSNCTDYQSSRLNIRWRGKLEDNDSFAYTLNGTGCAVTRVLKALVETHQQKDGTIALPEVLWPYMDGVKRLVADESPIIFR